MLGLILLTVLFMVKTKGAFAPNVSTTEVSSVNLF
jgi:hypothetical protein